MTSTSISMSSLALLADGALTPTAGASAASLLTATPWGPPPDFTIEKLPSIPSLTGLYAKKTAIQALRIVTPGMGSYSGTAPITAPKTAYRVSGINTVGLRNNLRDYQRLMREPASDTMSAGYLHILAYPVAATT
ncbi:MAG: hypothetical protein LBB54_00870, partial [Cellulomonadaceae bacterium]|nr:hypothetical protein [Cellulomonadaceae bacterium]